MRFIFYFLFFTTVLFSQNSGTVKYKILIAEREKKGNVNSQNLMGQIKEKSEKQVYILEFNESQSHFFLDKMLQDDSESNTSYKILAVLMRGDHYYDKAKNIGLYEETNGVLLKDDNLKKEWTVTSESKLIDNYTCYKAELLESYKSGGVEKTKLITAWFAPSLPYSFGPKGYNGLPGLIVELVDSNLGLSIYVDNIELTNNLKAIKFPKGKVINKEEYFNKISTGRFYKNK